MARSCHFAPSTRNAAAALAAVYAVTAITLASARPLHAEDAAPAVPEAIQRITPLAGRFEGTATYTVDGKTMQFTLRHENRVTAGGFALVCIESADSPELGHYASINMFGFDPGRGQLHLYTVDNIGDAHDPVGNWLGDRDAYFRQEGVVDGKPESEEIPFTVVSPPAGTFGATMKRQEMAMGSSSSFRIRRLHERDPLLAVH
jgi:hypothetical protein